MKKYNFAEYDLVNVDCRNEIRLSGYMFFFSLFCGVFSINTAIYFILCAIYMRIVEG